MQDVFPQPKIVCMNAVSRTDGNHEILIFGLSDKGLPYNWDRTHGQWMPWSDEQSKYPRFGEGGKIENT